MKGLKGIDTSTVGVKQAIVALRCGPRFHVLVKEREEVYLQWRVGAERGPSLRHHMLDKVGVIDLCIRDIRTGLVRVASRGPPGLGHHQCDVVVAERRDRRVHGVHLRVEHVVVHEARVVIPAPGVGLKEHVFERDGVGVALVCEERVDVDEERRSRGREEVEDRLHVEVGDGRVERAGGWRV